MKLDKNSYLRPEIGDQSRDRQGNNIFHNIANIITEFGMGIMILLIMTEIMICFRRRRNIKNMRIFYRGGEEIIVDCPLKIRLVMDGLRISNLVFGGGRPNWK